MLITVEKLQKENPALTAALESSSSSHVVAAAAVAAAAGEGERSSSAAGGEHHEAVGSAGGVSVTSSVGRSFHVKLHSSDALRAASKGPASHRLIDDAIQFVSYQNKDNHTSACYDRSVDDNSPKIIGCGVAVASVPRKVSGGRGWD
jgi:hypothetical protein